MDSGSTFFPTVHPNMFKGRLEKIKPKYYFSGRE